MSHVVEIQTRVTDLEAVKGGCRRLQLPVPVYGPVKLFAETRTGWGVQLPEWRYPVVCDVDRGEVAYDNYNGRWGDPRQLDRFLQSYAIEKAIREARRQGYSASEQRLPDGSVKVTVNVGGAA